MSRNRKDKFANGRSAQTARTAPTGRNSTGDAALLSMTSKRAHRADDPLTLGRRIFQLVWCEPFEHAIASLGKVTVSLLLAEADDPLKAFDGLASLMREMLVEAQRKDEVEHSVH